MVVTSNPSETTTPSTGMLSHVTSPLIVAPSLSGMSLTPSCVTVTSAETSAVLPVKVIRVLRPRPSLAGTVKVWTAICGETVLRLRR